MPKYRRHAAIMFTDIVGYTTLMGSDEDHAFEVLHKSREIHSKFIKKFNGTLIKEMGDGMLISFHLASDAVRCAKSIQRVTMAENIPLKIGIHEGEVVFEESDVLGDGVNIAARLQDSGDRGCIIISEFVYRDVKNKTDIKIEFMGERTFKNVEEPMKVYSVSYEEKSAGENTADNKENKGRNRDFLLSRSLRKIGVVIIAVLIGVVSVIIFTKLLRNDKFESIRDADGRISVAVMPFQNLTGDSLYYVWQGGFQNLLITTLSNSKELSIRQYQVMHALFQGKKNINYASISPALAGELAQKLDTRTFILGNILKAKDRIRVTAQLVNAKTMEVYKTFDVSGSTSDDIFNMADSLSSLIKNYLEIKQIAEQYHSPYISGSFNTKSAEAFFYFIRAYNAFMDSDYRATLDWGSKALQLDSAFISIYAGVSFAYSGLGDFEMAKRISDIAYVKRDELPLKERLMVEHLHACYYETPDEQIKYIKQILEIEPLNTLYRYMLGWAYYQKYQFNDALDCFKEVWAIHKKWGVKYHNPWYYDFMGASYHKINKHKKENDIYDLGLTLYPDFGNLLRDKAICALTRGDAGTAKTYISKYISVRKNHEQWSEANILSHVGDIYSEAGLPDLAETYYRQAYQSDPNDPMVINALAMHLIDHEIDVEGGIALVQKALDLHPDIWNLYDTKGWGLYKLGRYEEALKVLKDAWSLRPFYYHSGFLHIQEAENAVTNLNS